MKVVVIADARLPGFSDNTNQLNIGRALVSLNNLQASMLYHSLHLPAIGIAGMIHFN